MQTQNFNGQGQLEARVKWKVIYTWKNNITITVNQNLTYIKL
jgi:hypothetical protein